jgi:hypothetical protein
MTNLDANTARYDLFDRAEGRNFSLDNEKRAHTMVGPAGITLAEIIELARANGVIGKGSARSGVSEVHTPDGIYITTDDKRIDLSTPRKAAKVLFASWEAMEADEVAGGTGDAADCGVSLAA